jgi:rifampicin phosphotransferase
MTAAGTRRLRDVRLSDAAEVGRKAASLGELLAAGMRVPDGVVLTAAAAAMSADERRSLLRSLVEDLGDGPFAVRSSGIAEDGAEHSWAGIYESVLDVRVDDLATATDRCLASASGARAAGYEDGMEDPAAGRDGRLAVLVQQMVDPVAAGVALTADPVSGDRRSCIVTAVLGNGERLVAGEAAGDEWVIRGDRVEARRRPEAAIDRRQAERVAGEARRIALARGVPQDVEWALDSQGALWILQARPMTALPPEVSWEAPARGAYTRALRFGEWIPGPVTALFESWLLTALEDGLHGRLRAWVGQHAPRPYHVVVNGWYFYSLEFLSGRAFLRSLPDMLWHLVRSPRRVAGLVPPTVRHSVPVFERDWRHDVQPRYEAAVSAAEARVESAAVADLPALVDTLADLAGEYFASIAALGGAAYKLEMNLAGFYQRHLAASMGGSHLPLLAGFEPPADPHRHAVASLDWWVAPSADGVSATTPDGDHARIVDARRAAEEAASRTLAPSPRRLRAFRRLLAEAQHLVPIREEQARQLTLAWPVMRRAVQRIGEVLATRGVIAEPDDVFFLSRAEALAALSATGPVESIDVAARRARRDEQARLVAPLVVGRMNPVLRRLWEGFPGLVGATRSDLALASGTPVSPGRATGRVRVIRDPSAFHELQPGEVLVAPLTAPAWTPLFTRAVAVVTDVGSAAAHASVIAREYGIPAIVGCGDATSRLRTGMRVTVDGGTGNVEPG